MEDAFEHFGENDDQDEDPAKGGEENSAFPYDAFLKQEKADLFD